MLRTRKNEFFFHCVFGSGWWPHRWCIIKQSSISLAIDLLYFFLSKSNLWYSSSFNASKLYWQSCERGYFIHVNVFSTIWNMEAKLMMCFLFQLLLWLEFNRRFLLVYFADSYSECLHHTPGVIMCHAHRNIKCVASYS